MVEMEDNLLVVTAIVLMVSAMTVILGKTKTSTSFSSTQWPAGPKTLPIIGNLHQLGGDVFHVVLAKLGKLHGGVMTIWFGSWRPVIVISDIDTAWEVLATKSSDYSARDHFSDFANAASTQLINIFTSDFGPLWHNLRKALQNGPLGPLNVSAQISLQETDMEQMIRDMEQEAALNDGLVKPLDHLKKATLRLLSRLIFGNSFNNDSFIESMQYAVEDMIQIGGSVRLAKAFSYAKYLPSYKKAVKEFDQLKVRLENLLQPFLSSEDYPINSYINILQSQGYPEGIIRSCIFELYILGMDSTASTTTWALAYLIHDQVVQKKLYQDIKDKAGISSLVKAENLCNMKYLQAMMKETMRVKPIAPLALPHKAAKDTTLMGTKVAMGTLVIVNLYALHHDPNIWEDPLRFMPEMFLQGQDGRNAKAMEQSFLPFSAGMRTCAGIELGKLQVSLALANLISAFKWTSVVDGKLPDMSEELLVVSIMKTPLEARIYPRGP